MRQRTTMLILALTMMLFSINSCKLVQTDSGTVTAESLRISTGEISGWTENTAQYNTASSFTNITEDPGGLDGEAYDYNNGIGFAGGIIEELSNSDGTTARMIIMDFGDNLSASLAYEGASTKQIFNKVVLPNYPETEGILDVSASGSKAFYRQERFLVRLALTSFPNDNQAITYTEMFLSVLGAKINK